MAHFTLQIEDAGPLLNVQVGVSVPRNNALRRAGKPVPQPIAVKGLVDTGASCTSIDPSVVEELELSPTGDLKMVTPSTGSDAVIVPQYDVAIAIYGTTIEQQPKLDPVLPVAEFSLANQGFKVLVGRDVLAGCVLVYNGTIGHYTLCF